MLMEKHKVMEPFLDVPWEELTFKEVKKRTGKSSKSYLYNTLEEFVDREVLEKKKVGRTSVYRLKLELRKVQSIAGMAAEWIGWNRENIPNKDLERISPKIPTAFHSLIVTGSYARGEETKDSDLDVVVICPDGTDTQEVYAELRHECEMNIPTIHLYAFTASEFYQMLVNREENFGKETVRNSLVLSGGSEYYRIINEAIKNGFQG